MQCFIHPTTAAVGICKSCGKGVCARCAADTGVGLACQNACEERVLVLGQMVDNNAKVMQAAKAQTRSSNLFAVLLGAVFLAGGWWAHTHGNQSLGTALILGGSGFIMFVFGILRLMTEQLPKGER